MLGVYNQRTMEAKARMILNKYCPECLNKPTEVPLEKLAEALGIDIEYQYLTKKGEKVLGKLICTDGLTPYYDMELGEYRLLNVSANTIIIEARLADNEENRGRYRFTLAHEIAHWLIHRENIVSNSVEAAFDEEKHNTQMEKQADFFASALLMPSVPVKRYFFSLRNKLHSESEIINDMSQHFGVSKQAMQICLKRHNLI